MEKQIQQCPLITASEYDNCYFLIHRTYSHFFGDINDRNQSANYTLENCFKIITSNYIYLKDLELVDKLNSLTHYSNNDEFVEKAIKKYTEESSFCYLFNRLMRNIGRGLIKFSYFMGPFLFGLNKYVKENQNFAILKSMKLFRIIKCSQIDFYQYKINLGHIVCFPSLTSTSSQLIGFKPTNLANKANNNKQDSLIVKMIFNYNYSKGDISPGIIVEDKKTKNGTYLSSNPNEKEIILFPFTFARITKLEKEIIEGIEIQKVFLEIIDRKLFLEYTLKNDVKNRLIISNLE